MLVLLVVAFATDAIPAFAFKPLYNLFAGHGLFYTHRYTHCQRKCETFFNQGATRSRRDKPVPLVRPHCIGQITMKLKSILKTLMVATLAAISFGAASLFLLPPMARVFLWPGMHIGAVVARAIPSQPVYTLIPDGGGPLFVLISATSSIVFWTCAFTGGYMAFKRLLR